MELSPARRDSVLQAMKRYSSMVYRLAYAKTRNHADAEDIYQEVFLKLAKCDTEFVSGEQVKAWLIRVTVNCSVSLFRSAWRRHVLTVDALPEREAEETEDGRYEALNSALDALPARYRAVIHLHYYEDMSVDEISTALKSKPATVRSLLFRGRDRLRRELTRNKEAKSNV